MTNETILNGVSVDGLMSTIEAVKDNPKVGECEFRAKNTWIGGGHNRTFISEFHAALEDHVHSKSFELHADEPPVFLGEDQAPNPVEYVLTALAACVTTSMVYHAAAKGIAIKGVESRLEGDLDLRGFLGISDQVPVGYKAIRIYFKIDADLSREEKKALIEMGKKYSPVFNTIFHATPVAVELDDA